MRTVLWFRGKDLRLHDHAALHAACLDSESVIPLFVLAPRYFGSHDSERPLHRLQFMLDGLVELAEDLQARGSRLCIVHGPAETVVPKLVAAAQAQRVLAISSCEPADRRRDARIEAALKVPFVRFEYETLTVPGSVRTSSGSAFQVYTPFARAAQAQLRQVEVLPIPKRLPPLPSGLQLPEVALAEVLGALGVARSETIQRGGERAAQKRLRTFAKGPAGHYDGGRDQLGITGTSRLSADLRFGTLSVRAAWRAIDALPPAIARGASRYRPELLWREFAHHLLVERPSLLTEPFRADFRGFPWHDDEAGWQAWWRGETGYPIVDAAARELLHEGYVHNRARMISASFLTKHLLIDYRRGERHYLRHLTDGDLANNNLGWQWSAGCGCDAQPYFRVFNPITQGERFDPDGAYVRRHVPELAALPAKYIHAPWLAPASVLKDAGVALGKTYPKPIVDHAEARARYLLVATEHLGQAEGKRGAQANKRR
jgi:deoxyribodipyrimidine photo-lyase